MSLRLGMRFSSSIAALLAAAVTGSGLVVAQESARDELLDALCGGGYLIVMRHASSPRVEPDAASAAPGNLDRERQLDERGQVTAIAMGAALRRIGIPIGEVLTSPTFRAMQTAEFLDLVEARPVMELGDGGEGMRQDSSGARADWLRAQAGEPVPQGSNRLMITHTPNLVGAFGDAAVGVAEGESLIIKPETDEVRVVARVAIEQWPLYAAP